MTIILHLLIFIYTHYEVPNFGQVQELTFIFIYTHDEVPDFGHIHESMVGSTSFATIKQFPVQY